MLNFEAKQQQQERLDEFERDVHLVPLAHERETLLRMIDATRGSIRAGRYPYHLFDQLVKEVYPLTKEKPFLAKKD